ncbi:MAG: hypothetical protein D3910_18885 [Candidatus Electrothrix sp. ATG2]|nr:hypothetical protein [Candidatus Electrothrix sp. ATG2]
MVRKGTEFAKLTQCFLICLLSGCFCIKNIFLTENFDPDSIVKKMIEFELKDQMPLLLGK